MRIAIGPDPVDFAVSAVKEGGGEVVPLGSPAEGLVWASWQRLEDLRSAVGAQPALRWVQLPLAGIERVVEAGIIDDSRVWTCAKGIYAEPVAEHALLLALAGLREIPARVTARAWGKPAGRSLYDARVTILGGGGITEELLRLLAPFRVSATVVRRRASEPVPGAARVVDPSALHSVLPGSLVVFLALALTPETRGIIGASELELIGPEGWLVNVARGGHVDTDALVAALASGRLGGAGLDVTDPEPLPEGHPLWTAPRCIVTPHTADTWDMVVRLLGERVAANVAHFVAGEPLEGVVDPRAGY